jgi:FdhD protein
VSEPLREMLPMQVVGGRVPTFSVMVYQPKGDQLVGRPDKLAVEEPLQIRLGRPDGSTSTISITMRTPGRDFELVAGFLLSEGVISGPEDVRKIAYCLDPELDAEQRYNVVTADLVGEAGAASIERLVMTSSACGICGTASIEAVRAAGHPPIADGFRLNIDVLRSFPDLLRSGQRAFESTGGLHGVALISATGEVLALREDVGRHNAVDKVIGWAMLDGRLPLSETSLFVSGRISFEIVQKAVRAGIPVIAAVSAATSLAAKLAADRNVTLVGFLRGDRCTVYSGRERIVMGDPVAVGANYRSSPPSDTVRGKSRDA